MSDADETVIPRRLINNDREKEQVRSLVHLVEGGTIPMDLAAWWMSHVTEGASWIVGSGPGGIGKSTTMRSFLGAVPERLPFAIAMPGEITALADRPRCTISLELSDHRPPGYLWDQDLRDFFNLADAGHTLVGNVHADSLEQTHEQIVDTCGVPEAQFRHIDIIAFIWLEGYEPGHKERIKDQEARRYITTLHYSDGSADHETVYTQESGLSSDAPRDTDRESACREFLEGAIADGTSDLDALRARFLAWHAG